MKKAFGSLAMTCLGVGLSLASIGCEAQKCDVETGSGETREGVCLKSLKRFEGSNAMAPRNPTRSATSRASSAMVTSTPVPILSGAASE